MKRTSFGFSILMVTLVLASGWIGFRQWRQTMELKQQLQLVRMELDDLENLRAENQRLRQKQIPPQELDSLRADHAALPRLRAELEALSRPGL